MCLSVFIKMNAFIARIGSFEHRQFFFLQKLPKLAKLVNSPILLQLLLTCFKSGNFYLQEVAIVGCPIVAKTGFVTYLLTNTTCHFCYSN